MVSAMSNNNEIEFYTSLFKVKKNKGEKIRLVIRKVIEEEELIKQILKNMIEYDIYEFKGKITFMNKINSINTIRELGISFKQK